MKLSYTVGKIVGQTMGLPHARLFKSWERTVNALEKAGYNSYEIEVIAKDDQLCRTAAFSHSNGAPYTALVNEIRDRGILSGHPKLNQMVMNTFALSDGLELDANGVPCHRGTMPGNPQGGSILVPIGTPASCDPTKEQYWSM